MVTALDDFWVPGRGVLGEVPVALGSLDIVVLLDPSSERGDETGLCGPHPKDLHSAKGLRDCPLQGNQA